MWCIRPWVIPTVLALTGLLVVYIGWGSVHTPEALWAPGHLSRYHTDITDCQRCHQAFKGATDAKCLLCHTREGFQTKTPAEIGAFHHQVMDRQQPCLECHTEHRGALTSITFRPMHNPHGEFIFRVTHASSCSDCHGMELKDDPMKPVLLDNALVDHLIDEGEGAHRQGHFKNCLTCHIGGQVDIEEDEEDDDDEDDDNDD